MKNNKQSKKTNNNKKNNNRKLKEAQIKLKEKDNIIEAIQKQNTELKDNNEKIMEENMKNLKNLKNKEEEIDNLKRQLGESQKLVNKYMGAFKKSFFTRLFGKKILIVR